MRAIPSILVIDDNPEALDMLASLLTVLGTKNVCQAKSAEQGLDILKTQKFTVIISDYRLEGMDGVQFLEQLRAQGDQTPVLLLSGAPEKAKPFRVAAAPTFACEGACVMFDFTKRSVTTRISSGLKVTPGSPGSFG